MIDPHPTTRKYVTHELTWDTPGKVLLLTLSGDYTLEAANEVNQFIIQELEHSQAALVLLIDTTAMTRPYHFQQIRATQRYMDHDKMRLILVAANDKLIALAMMIIFSLGRARFQMFDDLQKARTAIQRQISNQNPNQLRY